MENCETIGIFHYQLGLSDGVSLEVEKWKTVLERMGHKVILVAGRLGNQDGVLLPMLYHHQNEIELINEVFRGERHSLSPIEMGDLIQHRVQQLETELKKAILENKIGVLLVNNIWSVGYHLPAAIALEKVRQELDLPTIAHHHDFYWERKGLVPDEFSFLNDLAEDYLPPQDPKIKHVVINSIAKKQCLDRKGINATIVPNVFEFESPAWGVDDFNRDLRQLIGLDQNDICVLQGTRIIPRKGIELAIDLVHALNAPHRQTALEKRGLYDGRTFTSDNKIVLVLAGYDRDDPTGEYLNKLKLKAEKLGVELRHVDYLIGQERTCHHARKIYSLWDAYTIADFVTYPSMWEGWGNQFLEAIKAKLPIVLFDYPVYKQDIEPNGFNVISLGSEITGRDAANLVTISEDVIQRAADQCVDYLTNCQLRKEMVEKNFQIGEQNYSYDCLRHHISNLIMR